MNTPPASHRRQHGVALITAVLIVSIAVIAATAVLDAGHFAIQRTATLQDAERAWGYATGAEDWVRTVLERDAEDNDIDTLDDAWATPQSLPVENGVIRGQIFDATAKFNLNNLGLADDSTNLGTRTRPDTEYQRQVRLFTRLIGQLDGASTLIPDPTLLAQAIRDWIDADQNPTGSGREDPDYLSLDPPYRAANRPMASVTELRSVLNALYDTRSDDAQRIYRLLLPQVTTLPVDGVTPINVNTATPELLMALSAGNGGNTRLREFIEDRKDNPIENPAQISERLELVGDDADPSMLTAASRLFQLQLETLIGNGRVALYSLIYRPDRGRPVVLVRSTDTE